MEAEDEPAAAAAAAAARSFREHSCSKDTRPDADAAAAALAAPPEDCAEEDDDDAFCFDAAAAFALSMVCAVCLPTEQAIDGLCAGSHSEGEPLLVRARSVLEHQRFPRSDKAAQLTHGRKHTHHNERSRPLATPAREPSNIRRTPTEGMAIT